MLFRSLPLVAAAIVLGASGLAHAQRAPLTKVMANLQDFGKAFARMEQERAEAEAESAKAQAELDALKKSNPQATEEAAKLKKRVDDADARVQQLTLALEGKKKDPLQDAAHKAEMDRLMKDRADAEADLTRAKAAYDDLSKQASPLKDRSDDAQKRIQGANAKLQQLNDSLRQIKPMEFQATTEDEANQAMQLPQKLQSLKQTLFGPYRLGSKLTMEQMYNPGTKQGTITFHWHGYL